jgi:hypothetical protein
VPRALSGMAGLRRSIGAVSRMRRDIRVGEHEGCDSQDAEGEIDIQTQRWKNTIDGLVRILELPAVIGVYYPDAGPYHVHVKYVTLNIFTALFTALCYVARRERIKTCFRGVVVVGERIGDSF